MTAVFTIPTRVYYEDTDASGVVYYANYLRFMERARSDWLRDVGLDVCAIAENQGALFVVRTAAIDYLKPARLSDLLTVSVAIKRLGRASLEVEQEIRKDHALLCRGTIKLVSVDTQTFLPRPIPDEVRIGIDTWKLP